MDIVLTWALRIIPEFCRALYTAAAMRPEFEGGAIAADFERANRLSRTPVTETSAFRFAWGQNPSSIDGDCRDSIETRTSAKRLHCSISCWL